MGMATGTAMTIITAMDTAAVAEGEDVISATGAPTQNP